MHVLFLTQRLPYAPNRGDRIRAFHVLRALESCATVTVVSLVHDDEEYRHAAAMFTSRVQVYPVRVPWLANRMRAALRLPSRRPLTLDLLHAPRMSSVLHRIVADRPPDVVLAYCSSMARYALEPPLDRHPFVLDMVDVDSQKWAALGRTQKYSLRGLVYRREARCLAAFERRAVRAATATLCTNEREEASIRELVPEAHVRVVPNGIDVQMFRRSVPPESVPVAVFCGVMSYAPNVDAATRLARRIWPAVVGQRPDARLLLVGADPTPAVRALAGESVVVTGAVPDVRPYLWQSAVAVAPLIIARGIQNKVLEALAAGLPTLVTPTVAAGLPTPVLDGCRVADTDGEFARQLLDLFALTPEQRSHMAARARLDDLTWERQLSALPQVLRRATEGP